MAVERFRRQGKHGGTLYVLEQTRAGAVTLSELPMTQLFQQLPDCVIQILEAEEGAMTQSGDDPTFGYEHP